MLKLCSWLWGRRKVSISVKVFTNYFRTWTVTKFWDTSKPKGRIQHAPYVHFTTTNSKCIRILQQPIKDPRKEFDRVSQLPHAHRAISVLTTEVVAYIILDYILEATSLSSFRVKLFSFKGQKVRVITESRIPYGQAKKPSGGVLFLSVMKIISHMKPDFDNFVLKNIK